MLSSSFTLRRDRKALSGSCSLVKRIHTVSLPINIPGAQQLVFFGGRELGKYFFA
jgi:hypothetical protein